MGEKRSGSKEGRKPKKTTEKTIAAAPSLKGISAPPGKGTKGAKG